MNHAGDPLYMLEGGVVNLLSLGNTFAVSGHQINLVLTWLMINPCFGGNCISLHVLNVLQRFQIRFLAWFWAFNVSQHIIFVHL